GRRADELGDRIEGFIRVARESNANHVVVERLVGERILGGVDKDEAGFLEPAALALTAHGDALRGDVGALRAAPRAAQESRGIVDRAWCREPCRDFLYARRK